jgi:hypothetical protein
MFTVTMATNYVLGGQKNDRRMNPVNRSDMKTASETKITPLTAVRLSQHRRPIFMYIKRNLDSSFPSGILKRKGEYGETIEAGIHIK